MDSSTSSDAGSFRSAIVDAPLAALPLDIRAEKQMRERKLKDDNTLYLQAHPEIELLLQDFITAALVEQPVDIFDFARSFFTTPTSETLEDGLGASEERSMERETDKGDEGSESTGNAGGIGNMLETEDELTDALKQIFEAVGGASDGEITKEALLQGLESDSGVQQLISSVGGDPSAFMERVVAIESEQLTFAVFEQLFFSYLGVDVALSDATRDAPAASTIAAAAPETDESIAAPGEPDDAAAEGVSPNEAPADEEPASEGVSNDTGDA